jgi:hypothetical protein
VAVPYAYAACQYPALVSMPMDRPPSGRLGRILNAPFTIWFMSSVVLAGVAAGVTRWQQENLERRERVERLRRLTIEVRYRLRVHAGDISRVEFADLVARLNGRDEGRDIGAFVDFKGVPVEPIFDEYCQLLPPGCTIESRDLGHAAWMLSQALASGTTSPGQDSRDLQVIQNASFMVQLTKSQPVWIRQHSSEESPGGGFSASMVPFESLHGAVQGTTVCQAVCYDSHPYGVHRGAFTMSERARAEADHHNVRYKGHGAFPMCVELDDGGEGDQERSVVRSSPPAP